MRIILMGPKSSGKTITGRAFAEEARVNFFDLDEVIMQQYHRDRKEELNIGEIYLRLGREGFRSLESEALSGLDKTDWCVISVGGSTPMSPEARRKLRRNSILVLFTASLEVLWERTLQRGRMPAYLLEEDDPRAAFFRRVESFLDVIRPYADIIIDKSRLTPEEAVKALREAVADEFQLRMESPNSFGKIVRVTTFGESHGPALGAVLDGVPPGIDISIEKIQREMARRRPGQSQVSTSRRETDEVEILSGIFEGRTTGAPIAMLIRNQNQNSVHYEYLRQVFRPGHADFTFFQKFGLRDHRGGGRSSGRETASRVAAGTVARAILQKRGINIIAFAEEIGGIKGKNVDLSAIENNSVRSADPTAASLMESRIIEARENGDSVGGIVQLRVQGVPAGLGDPIFFKLDARLTMAIMSLGAVKGVEIGSGFQAAAMTGSEQNDQMEDGRFLSNHAGGILGGISSGQDIIIRLAVKPTPSISRHQSSVDEEGNNIRLSIEGRHDPCIVPRLIPVVEAMTALVLLDACEMQKGLKGEQ